MASSAQPPQQYRCILFACALAHDLPVQAEYLVCAKDDRVRVTPGDCERLFRREPVRDPGCVKIFSDGFVLQRCFIHLRRHNPERHSGGFEHPGA
jgi:hypothetical protein